MEQKQEVCPFCGGTELAVGKQAHSYAKLIRGDALVGLTGRTLFHVICLRCGTVVRSYVEDPEYFAK